MEASSLQDNVRTKKQTLVTVKKLLRSNMDKTQSISNMSVKLDGQV